MNLSIHRLITRISVRTRIIVLAVIPVIGFLVNGIAFTVGESEVEQRIPDRRARIRSRRRQPRIQRRAVRDAHATRDFAARPSQDLIQTFEAAHATAVRTLGRHRDRGRRSRRGKTLVPLKAQLDEDRRRSSPSSRTTRKFSASPNPKASRNRMTKAATAVERIIHEDMSWLSEADAQKLLISLLTMRRYETEYRLTRSTLMQTCSSTSSRTSTSCLDDIVGADILKEQLAQQVKAYADTFAEWIAIVDKIGPPVALIDFNIKNMMPVADEIIGSAKSSHQRGVGCAHGVASAHQNHHRLRRARGRADRAWASAG